MAEKLKDRYGNVIEKLKLMICIVSRGQGDRVVQELRQFGVTYNMATTAYGAVGLDIEDMLGLTETDCDIVFSVLTESKTKAAMSMIEYKFSLDEDGKGISFCVPITGVGGPLSLKYISGNDIKSNMRSEGDRKDA